MESLHLVFNSMKLMTVILAFFGLLLSMLTLLLPNCRYRNKFMYFGARVLVGSIIVLLVVIILNIMLNDGGLV